MTAKTSPSQPLTLIQMNLWDGRLIYPIQHFLEQEKPDIMTTQEVLLSQDPGYTHGFCTAQSLVNKGYMSQFFHGIATDWIEIGGTKCQTTVANFVKTPVRGEGKPAVSIHRLNETSVEKPGRPDSYHSLQHTVIHTQDGFHANILTFHGRVVIGTRLGTPDTDHDFQQIADYIARLSGPIILAGDFNLDKDASSLKFLKEIGLTNLNDTHTITEARNEFAWKQNEAVCHVFVSDDILVDTYRVAKVNVSDHYPLVVRFRIRN